jgi:hypothetical protein
MDPIIPLKTTKRQEGGGAYEFIELPNVLRARTGKPVFDPQLLAKAETAVASLQENYEGWIADTLARLRATVAGLAEKGERRLDQQVLQEVFLIAHDMRGLGGSFGYPYVTDVAGLLCKLVRSTERITPKLVAAVEAHVEALTAVIANKVAGSNDPVTRQVVDSLRELSQRLPAEGGTGEPA